MNQSTVSICIPTYNRAWCLKEAIDSALMQTRSVYEVLVMDAGSTDDTATVVQAYSDPRVRYERNPNNPTGYFGTAHNWNRAMEMARGDYLVLCGDDDKLAPDFIEKHVAVLDVHQEVGLVYCACLLTDAEWRITKELWPFSQSHVWSGKQELEFMARRHYIYSAPMLRCQYLQQIGLLTTDMLTIVDWDFWLRFACHGGVGYVAAPLYIKRDLRQKEAYSFDTKTLETINDRTELLVERVLAQAKNIDPRYIEKLNRWRYSEIAKGKIFLALTYLRQRNFSKAIQTFQNAWYWQINKAGWRDLPRVLWDNLTLLRKRWRGRTKYIFDIYI